MSGMDRCALERCGALTDKIISYISGFDDPLTFCCMDHKKEWLNEHEHEQEAQAATEAEEVLPKVRVLVGHKQKDGTITVVPREGEVPEQYASGASGRAPAQRPSDIKQD
jgi:hypothetical protein